MRGGGLRGLLSCRVDRFPAAPEHRYGQPASGPQRVSLPRREAEGEELWSCGGRKANRQGVGLAREALTRPLSAFPGGARSRQSAHAVWEKIPAVSQEQARVSPDGYEAEKGVLPSAPPPALPTLARNPTHGERFTGPLRQRGARVVRATVSFSKQLTTHSDTLKYFMCDDNLTRRAA